MLWTAGLTVVSSVVFGLVPALAFTRNADGQPLHSSRAGSLQLRSRRLHRGLVLSEIALSIVPLIAAGLMLRTFANLLETPIGFDPAHVVTARVSLNLGVFSTVNRRSMFYRDAIARVRELPGVEGASIGGPPPLAPAQSTLRFRRSDDGEGTIGMHRSVMPGYLGVMGIPLRAGRDISDDDIIHGRRVTVVDERLAAQLWQGDAIGKRLSVEYSKQPLEVVGVAAHIRARDIRDPGTLMICVPSHVYEIEQTLVVKTRAPFSTIRPAIKEAVEALGPGRPVFDIRPMDDIVQASIDNTRFTMLVLSGSPLPRWCSRGSGCTARSPISPPNARRSSACASRWAHRLAAFSGSCSERPVCSPAWARRSGCPARSRLRACCKACCTASRRSMGSPLRASARSLPPWRSSPSAGRHRAPPASIRRRHCGRSRTILRRAHV